jgi:hypothetical protein
MATVNGALMFRTFIDNLQARLAPLTRLASLREIQSATGEELDALLPSVLDMAFKGEL